jgi:hypothetical protein
MSQMLYITEAVKELMGLINALLISEDYTEEQALKYYWEIYERNMPKPEN